MARKRKKKESSEAKVDRNAWMVTFTDLNFLMLCFFVLLLSMASLDAKRLKETFGFFMSAAGVLDSGQNPEVEPDLTMQVEPIVPNTLVKGLRRFLEVKKEERSKGFMELQRMLLKEDYRDLVDVELYQDQIRVHLSNRLFFEPGQAAIRPEIHDLLREVGRMVIGTPYRLRVEAYSVDESFDRRRYRTAWELALTRATRVVKFLIGEGGAPPPRLSVAGFGRGRGDKDELVGENRVELIFIVDQGQASGVGAGVQAPTGEG